MRLKWEIQAFIFWFLGKKESFRRKRVYNPVFVGAPPGDHESLSSRLDHSASLPTPGHRNPEIAQPGVIEVELEFSGRLVG
jgi:hypothetical protein